MSFESVLYSQSVICTHAISIFVWLRIGACTFASSPSVVCHCVQCSPLESELYIIDQCVRAMPFHCVQIGQHKGAISLICLLCIAKLIHMEFTLAHQLAIAGSPQLFKSHTCNRSSPNVSSCSVMCRCMSDLAPRLISCVYFGSIIHIFVRNLIMTATTASRGLVN